MNTESLITDLAFILLLGAIVTVVFKWIKQPVVLGYIVAGFLASPHFEYLPSVTTEENIDFWAEIGIVVLLFALGLEFSFKKLLNSGGSAVVTALIVVTGMMGAGFALGHAMHFNTINSLFLGGMLSMSSTTIIIKAFTDLGLKQKKFASLVLAVLIVEDLFAVVMMVLLSSIAINNSVEGSELLYSIGKLVFFLLIWFAVGVYILPSLLNGIRRFLNSETLLVVSMGLCLGMAVFSVYCGFSMALGAFVMGSILAGTSYAERIEHVVTPVKDLFGSVFFISVGMMVRPDILAGYWLPILILSLVVIIGMIIFGTAGMLVTGQTLKVAIESGFSLTQIGEFAFIIASLGMSLGVLEPTLYPIVVAVSVITTFTTPFFIKASVPFYNFVERHLPRRLHFLIERYHKDVEKNEAAGASWKPVLKRYLWRTALYSVVLLGISIVSQRYLLPYMQEIAGEWGNLASVVITLLGMSPFLMALMQPLSASSGEHGVAEARAAINALPRTVMTIFRFIIAIFFVTSVISEVYSKRTGVIFVVAAVILVAFFFSRRLRKSMTRIESRFIDNLNERELRRSGKNNSIVGDLHLAYMTVGTGCDFAGERLINSDLRHRYGVNVVSIQRGTCAIPIPSGQERLFPGDTVGIIGTEAQIEAILPDIEKDLEANPNASGTLNSAQLTSILLTANSPLAGKTPRNSDLRNRYDALVVAVDRGDEHIDSKPDLVFEPGDLVWLVGDPHKLASLK
ncbi:MAG: cation:proton antiporter [Muribaculaceae bacterium]|nr:cation:proton antiporter [Muribaculaceae bacterium]